MDIPVGMKFPLALPWFFGLFVPTVSDQHIVASITIDVADTHPVLISRLTDDLLFERVTGLFSISDAVVDKPPNGQWVLGIPAIDDPIGNPVFIDIMHQLGFVFGGFGVDP